MHNTFKSLIIKNKMKEDEVEEFIKSHGGKSVEAVCSYCANSLRKKLKKRNIVFVEIEDVVHDAMILLITRIQDGTLDLKCSFSTYLYGSCTHVISYICRLNERKDESEKAYAQHSHNEKYLEILIEEEERLQLMKEALAIKHKLGPRFEKLLRLTAKGVCGKKLRTKMGFKNLQEEKEYKLECGKIIRSNTSKGIKTRDLFHELLRLYT